MKYTAISPFEDSSKKEKHIDQKYSECELLEK